MTNKQEILLESGTNELEVIVFEIANRTFGINVLKVREIINPLPIVEIPNSHPFIEGIIRLREEVLPVVDLAKALHLPSSENPEKDKYIVAELNQFKVVFHVHSVSRIYRVSWKQIEKTSELTDGLQNSTLGIIKMEDQMVLLLDYEKIILDIAPNCGIQPEKVKFAYKNERNEKVLLFTEDSPVLRQQIEEAIKEAGYGKLIFFNDGLEAWKYLQKMREEYGANVLEHVHAVITDIEMPQMDGHHLTKKIKNDEYLKDLPVIIFSSLVTEDLYHKGFSVGCDAQISKPDIAKLVETIDELVLKQNKEIVRNAVF